MCVTVPAEISPCLLSEWCRKLNVFLLLFLTRLTPHNLGKISVSENKCDAKTVWRTIVFLSQCSSLELDMFQGLVCAHNNCGLHLICSILGRPLCDGFAVPCVQGQKWPDRDSKYIKNCFSLWNPWKVHPFHNFKWPWSEPWTLGTNCFGPQKEAISRQTHSLWPSMTCSDRPFKRQPTLCDLRCFSSTIVHL